VNGDEGRAAHEAYSRRFNVRYRDVTQGQGVVQELAAQDFAKKVAEDCLRTTTVYGICTADDVTIEEIAVTDCSRATCTAAVALCVANRLLDLADVPGTAIIETPTQRLEVANQTAEARASIFGSSVQYIRRAASTAAATLEQIDPLSAKCKESDIVSSDGAKRGMLLAGVLAETYTLTNELVTTGERLGLAAGDNARSFMPSGAEGTKAAFYGSEMSRAAIAAGFGGRRSTSGEIVPLAVCTTLPADITGGVSLAEDYLRLSGANLGPVSRELLSQLERDSFIGGPDGVGVRLEELTGVAAFGGSATDFYGYVGLSPTDFSVAITHLAQEGAAFGRTSLTLPPRVLAGGGTTTFPVHAGSATPPTEPLPQMFMVMARDVGAGENSIIALDMRPDGLGDGFISPDFPIASSISKLQDTIITRAAALFGDSDLGAETISPLGTVAADGRDARPGRLELCYRRSATDHVVELRVLGVAAAGRLPQSDMLAVVGNDGFRCATEGNIEGVACRIADYTIAPNLSVEQVAPAADPAEVGFSTFLRFSKTFPATGMAAVSESFPVFVLKRKPGAGTGPGSYEPLVSTVVALPDVSPSALWAYCVAEPINPLIEFVGGRALTPYSGSCDRPATTCTILPEGQKLPLEDDLTDDGDALEDSWRHYLDLAANAAAEADRLGEDVLTAGEAIDTRAEVAATVLAERCGADFDLTSLFEPGPATSHGAIPCPPTCPGTMECRGTFCVQSCSTDAECGAILGGVCLSGLCVQDPVEAFGRFAADAPSARRLRECLDPLTVVPLSTLGASDVCVWRRNGDPTSVCAPEFAAEFAAANPGHEAPACPWDALPDDAPARCAIVLETDVTAAPVMGYELVKTDVAIGLSDTASASLGGGGSRSVGPAPCAALARLRESPAYAGRDADLTEVVSSGLWQPETLKHVADRLGWEARFGDYSAVTLDGMPFYETGRITTGPASAAEPGPCAIDPGVDCRRGGVFCGVADCTDRVERAEVNDRMARAVLAARITTASGVDGLRLPFVPPWASETLYEGIAVSGVPVYGAGTGEVPLFEASNLNYGWNTASREACSAGLLDAVVFVATGGLSAGVGGCARMTTERQSQPSGVASCIEGDASLTDFYAWSPQNPFRTLIEAECLADPVWFASARIADTTANEANARILTAALWSGLGRSYPVISAPGGYWDWFGAALSPDGLRRRPDEIVLGAGLRGGRETGTLGDPSLITGYFGGGTALGTSTTTETRIRATLWAVPLPLSARVGGTASTEVTLLENKAAIAPEGLERQDLLNGMELLCEAAQTEGQCDITAPPRVESVEGLRDASGFASCVANTIQHRFDRMLFVNVPQQAIDSIRYYGTTGTYPATGGDYGESVSTIARQFVAISSALDTVASQVASMATDMDRLRNQLAQGRSRLAASDLRTLGDISSAQAACFAAISPSISATGFVVTIGTNPGAAIATCANAYAQIDIAGDLQALNAAQLGLEDEAAAQIFRQSFEDRASVLADQAQNLSEARHEIDVQLSLLETHRTLARRALSSLFLMADGTMDAHRTGLSSFYGRRYNTRVVRYRAALETAKRLAQLARIAIEQRLGMRLTDIGRDLVVVEEPRRWVDSLCTLEGIDYERLRASGAPFDPGESEYIGDYVNKLALTVEGYRLAYPYQAGTDTTVLSLRDEIKSTRADCEVESPNHLLYSDNLTAIVAEDSSDAGWRVEGCTPDAEGNIVNCLVVGTSPTTFDAPPFAPYDPAIATTRGSRVTFKASATDTPGVYQDVALSGGTYAVSWYGRTVGAPADTLISPRDVVLVEPAVVGGAIDHYPTSTWLSDAVTPDELEWNRYYAFFRVSGPGSTSVRIRVRRPSVGPEDKIVDVGAFMIEQIDADLSAVEAAPARFVPAGYWRTEDHRVAIMPACEDTTGVRFRGQHWVYDCDRTCARGRGEACDPTATVPQCFWETEFDITPGAVDEGRFFRAGGFADGNFNYRIESLSLNFVGSAARVCADDRLPSTCYSAGYIPYSLQHTGRFTVRNFVGEPYDAPLFIGNIHKARGLAAERYVTNPLSSADRSLVTPYSRTEFRGRPVSGTYKLRVWDVPGVNFNGIEDVQLVLDYRYWTRFE